MKKSIGPQKPLLVIVGTNASGKSALAVKLAQKFNGEIVSADSRQVYRGLNIGTGKLTKQEMRGIPHHLLDVASLRRTYTVKQYQRDARRAIHAIWQRGKLPILCGGTGLYIRAVVDGVVFPEVPPNPKLRTRLARKTTAELFALLKKKDPRRAKAIDRHNPHRLIRALEIIASLGKVPVLRPHRVAAHVFMLGVTLPKEKLAKRIAARLNARLRRGMVAEVKRLRSGGASWKRLNNLGLEYRWIARYLQGTVSKEVMERGLQRDIVRYARRQMTWFKRDARIHWLHDPQKAFSFVKQFFN
ncbi:MAG: tRNA (adenosine(37)-N6)-dimethylallyltransferase MiaA [Candidatus Jorgensenbacteria bacterium]|nr:tRNA (adenosine(37)-N6)-dimethylallyltransferase MiaA [Candidatus Jorgensenbacteria bacterium]